MRIGVQRANSFLDPTRGKLVIFVAKERSAGLQLGGLVTSCLSAVNSPYAVLDLDAFYASERDGMRNGNPPNGFDQARFVIPEVGSSVSDALLGFIGISDAKVLILDNLNSLYHLLSSEQQASAARKLAFTTAVMSQIARTNGVAILCTVYEREGPRRVSKQRSLTEGGDATVVVSLDEGKLFLTCRSGSLWPSGTFSYP
jgi:hypothetical protein